MQFNATTSPINKGLTLLEASAGTGKTYSLVRIIVRHIVEQSIPIRNILTVTFTVAATAEIRQRLFIILNEVIDQIHLPAEQISNDLVKHWISLGPDMVQKVKSSTSIALAEFDSCNIFTIDAFFQRVQTEFSFECGTSFNREIEPDNQQLVETALRDYWRTHVYPKNTEELSIFLQNISFSSAFDFIKNKTAPVSLDSTYSNDTKNLITTYTKHWHKLVELTHEHFDDLEKLISNPPAVFSKAKAPFTKTTPQKAINLLREIKDNPNSIIIQLGDINNLRSSYLLSDIPYKKNQSFDLDAQPYAEFCYTLEQYLSLDIQLLKSAYLGEIYHYVLKRLEFIKKQRSVFTYDDVTQNLASVLKLPRQGQLLQNALSGRYQAVLIDEFQDTSPAQCSVFVTLFHNPFSYFHIIGDPKQSIYRFRGADVFSYISASKKADHHYSLTRNFRSSPRLIEATNFLFSQSPDPFISNQQITFTPSQPGTPQEELPDHKNIPVFHFLHIDEKTKASELIYPHITNHIVGLNNQKWSDIAPQSNSSTLVNYSDFAILVSTTFEANEIAKMLENQGIPHTLHTQTSLMQSTEANDTYLLLQALLNPSRISLVRTALLTPTFGCGKYLSNTEQWQQSLDVIVEANKIWNSRGILASLLYVIDQFKLRKYLVSLPSGLRRITNLIHLTEVLDNKARQDYLSMQRSVEWMEQAIQDNVNDSLTGTLELKLSTDSSAVTILTQHRSKGLQFPITFVMPSCKQSPQEPELSYHDQATGEIKIAPYGDKEAPSYNYRLDESMADRARLAYVALTRAEQICFFYYQSPKEAYQEKHPTFLMLGSPDDDELANFSHASNHSIAYTTLCENTSQPKHLEQTKKTAEITQSLSYRDSSIPTVSILKRTSSFTGITKSHHNENHHVSPQDFLEDQGIWKEFIPGAALGSMFHEILEDIDFTNSDQWKATISGKLNKYAPLRANLDDFAKETLVIKILDCIQIWMNHSLDGSLKLNSIPNKSRLIEPEFTIKGDHFSLETFLQSIKKNPPAHMPAEYTDQIAHLPPEYHQGFLTGFIDLIFEHEGRYHLLDWKTNKILGKTTDDLALVMANNHYYLQYYLYTLALDQFLSIRLGEAYNPEQHLGNVYYIFLRGIDSQLHGSGIFKDSFSLQRLQNLRSTFTSSSSK